MISGPSSCWSGCVAEPLVVEGVGPRLDLVAAAAATVAGLAEGAGTEGRSSAASAVFECRVGPRRSRRDGWSASITATTSSAAAGGRGRPGSRGPAASRDSGGRGGRRRSPCGSSPSRASGSGRVARALRVLTAEVALQLGIQRQLGPGPSSVVLIDASRASARAASSCIDSRSESEAAGQRDLGLVELARHDPERPRGLPRGPRSHQGTWSWSRQCCGSFLTKRGDVDARQRRVAGGVHRVGDDPAERRRRRRGRRGRASPSPRAARRSMKPKAAFSSGVLIRQVGLCEWGPNQPG